MEKFYNIGPGYPDTSVRPTQHDAIPAVIALNNTVGKKTLPNMPRNKTGFPQPPMTRSRWCDLPSTRQRDPPRRTLLCRYTTPGSKTWVNRTNKVRNFHLILIIMNDGYVLRQFANTEHHLLNPKTTEYDSLLYLNHIQTLYSITGEERINKIMLKWHHIDVSVLYKNRESSHDFSIQANLTN